MCPAGAVSFAPRDAQAVAASICLCGNDRTPLGHRIDHFSEALLIKNGFLLSLNRRDLAWHIIIELPHFLQNSVWLVLFFYAI